MTEKKSPAFENHAHAMRVSRHIERQCDPAIRHAIETVQVQVAEHHATSSKGMSLRTIAPLLRKYVDIPVSDWLQKYDEEPFAFSSLLVEEGMRGTFRFDNMKMIKLADDDWTFAVTHPDLSATASSLITLAFFCCAHKGDSQDVVTITSARNPATKVVETEIAHTRSKKKALSASSLNKALHPSIQFSDGLHQGRYCKLCRNLTGQAEELLRVFRMPLEGVLSPKLKELLSREDVRFNTPEYSDEYCEAHTSAQSHSTYKKAYAKRERYYATRRLLIEARLQRGLSAGNFHILRTASFLIVDECPNKKLIRDVPGLIYRQPDLNSQAERALKTPLADHLALICDSFTNERHPLAELVNALTFGTGSSVYDAAKACDVLTDREEYLMEIGFIYDPIRIALANGAEFYGRVDE